MKPVINVRFQDLVIGLIDERGFSIEELAYKCRVSTNIVKNIYDGKTKKVEHSCGNLIIHEWSRFYFDLKSMCDIQ